ncbi:MAG: hypothetical protein LBU73_02565 [Helicobacteraceae bacterium]|jgi:hypothetical protein|nr:hypothetical protein [Helicobacteraceae bacterium]
MPRSRGFAAVAALLFALAGMDMDAAIFETYYGGANNASPNQTTPPQQNQPAQITRPPFAPRNQQNEAPRVIGISPVETQNQQSARQNPQNEAPRVIGISPVESQNRQNAAAQSPARAPFNPPQNRLIARTAAPHGHFDLGGNFLARGGAGYSRLNRRVRVKTANANDVPVYYKPNGDLIGLTDGGDLTYRDRESRLRFFGGAGYQFKDDGNFWYAEYAREGELRAFDLTFAITAPSMPIGNTILFFKIGAEIGYSDSEKRSPSSLGFKVGFGGYNYLGDARHWRLEYDADYTRSEWLAIPHNYGKEVWEDSLWRLNLALAYKF